MRWAAFLTVWFSVVAAMTAPAAHADSKPPTPWSRGVPEAAQKRALQLFQEGNALLEQEKYTEAWDHLQQALRFGEAPLGKRLFSEAMRYVALLESSLSELTVRSTQPGIKVMVDGVVALDGPGEHSMTLLAGKHQLVASRPGYTTLSRALDLGPGKSDVEQIALELEKVTVQRFNYERRWAWWVPWSVEGGAAALALVAAGFYVSASGEMTNYDNALRLKCQMGCTADQIPSNLKSQYDHARRNSGVAVGMWVGAGAVAITGGVMAVMNRPFKVERRAVTPSVAVSRDYVGAAISFALE